MNKIYFAAPLFNEMELERNRKYTDILRKLLRMEKINMKLVNVFLKQI